MKNFLSRMDFLMKTYEYKIKKDVYDLIKSGLKNIEYRLKNEKSESINKGDLIVFSVQDSDNYKITVRVLDKFIYDNLDSLWEAKELTNNNVLNLTKDEFIEKFNMIFGEDKVFLVK